MNDIKVFSNPEFGSIRTLEINREPYFVGKDVTEALGYSNTRKALADHVDEEDKGVKNLTPLEESNSQGFVENEDYTSVLSGTVVNNGAHREIQDYSLSVDMAKHICLMSRTEKGKQIRQYFIDLEKAWNTPEQIMARALKVADKRIELLKQDNVLLAQDVERMRPKEIFADAVAASHTSILISELAKLLKQSASGQGRNRKDRSMMTKKYIRRAVGDIATNLPPLQTYNTRMCKAVKSELLKNT